MGNKQKLLELIILPAVKDTIYMVSFATLYAGFIGLILAIILVVTDKNGLRPNIYIYRTLDIFINVIRSFPFIILVISIVPLTRLIVGTSIGRGAAVFPLTILSSALVARLIENNLKEVDKGIVKAARSFGASNLQIIFKVMIVEALPSICSSITLAMVGILGSSAMAGAVGAGGLGSVAIIYGYQSFNDFVIVVCVAILIVLVQFIQSVGNHMYRRLQ